MDPLIVDRAPDIAELKWASITPRLTQGHAKYSGEVYNKDGSVCELSLRKSDGYQHIPYSSSLSWLAKRSTIRGRHMYGGQIFEMFGHDLIETPARLWPLLDPSFSDTLDGVIFHRWRNDSRTQQVMSGEPVASLLSAFGISLDRVHIVEDDIVEVERLVVPEITFKIANHALPDFKLVALHISDHFRTSEAFPDKIYLSRRRLPGKPRLLAEQHLETIAESNGFTVLHPQSLSLSTQINMMRGASHIAGVDGSAMHLGIFCKPGTQVTCFDTRQVRTQFIIEELFELVGQHIRVDEDETEAIAVSSRYLQNG